MKTLASHFLVATFACLSLATVGCMQDNAKPNSGNNEKTGGNETLEQLVIENTAQNVIVAAYRDLYNETKALAKLSAELKASPTQAKLEAVQAKWKEARIPWESTEGFLFGPVQSLAVDPAIDSWPLSKTDLDTILATRPNIDAAFVRRLGTDLQGFHTAEYLIFGDGIKSNTKSVEEMTPAQLQYLSAVTEVLAEQTQKLFVAWTEQHDTSNSSAKSYLDILQKPGFDNQFYSSRQAVFQEFVRGMINIAVEVGTGKLSDPLGGDLASADPSLVESQFSWNSITDFQNNMKSMQHLYTGDYGGRNGAGLDDIIKLRNADLNTKVQTQMKAAEQAILDIGGPEKLSYTLAIKNPAARERAKIAMAKIAEVEATLQNELLPLFQ